MRNVLEFFTSDSAKRRFVKDKGLFDKGIKIVESLNLSTAEQIKEIKKLPGVSSFDKDDLSYYVDLGWAGKYKVYIRDSPKVEQLGGDCENPFLGSSGGLCLGTAVSYYNRSYAVDNILDCAKIINLILSCEKDSRGYRRWSTSTLVKKRLSR
jgi:hypothetical protein